MSLVILVVDKLTLLRGKPIANENYTITPLTIGQIEELGQDLYNSLLSIILIDQEKLKKSNVDIGEDYDDVLQLFTDVIKSNEDLLIRGITGLSIFTGIEFDMRYGQIFRIDDGRQILLDLDDFLFIREAVRQHNFMKSKDDADEFKPANSKAEELKKRIMAGRQKALEVKSGDDDSGLTLSEIASCVANFENNGVTVFNVWDLTVYQLYDAYIRLQLKDEYLNFNLIRPHLDPKAEINQDHWSKKIDP
jgi:hypothetical protein